VRAGRQWRAGGSLTMSPAFSAAVARQRQLA
jgi:hypothetical protein